MSELRAPDPTLTAYTGWLAGVTYDVDPPRAHRPGGCRGHEDCDFISRVDHVRWFTVPCRECFPDAPEPGGGHDDLCGIEGCTTGCGPDDLDWQIPVDNATS